MIHVQCSKSSDRVPNTADARVHNYKAAITSMYSTAVLAALAAATIVVAAPTGDSLPPNFPELAERFNTTFFELDKRAGTPSSEGFHNGYFYLWSIRGRLGATYANLEGGKYSIQWEGGEGEFVGGKGWNPGGAK
jgi:hypothetical protein